MEEQVFEFEKLISILKDGNYKSNNDMIRLLSQNIIGFSGAMIIQALRNKITNIDHFSQVLMHSSFYYLLLDNLIVNTKRKKHNNDKLQAFRQVNELLNALKTEGILIDEKSLMSSYRETNDSKKKYYYTFDIFNNIIILSEEVTKNSLFEKEREFGVSVNNYEYLSLYKIGSILTDVDGRTNIYGEDDKVAKKDDETLKTYYQLSYKQVDNIGIFTFYVENDDIKILSTEGIDNLSEKEKYLKLCLALQDIGYKKSNEVNAKIKEKIFTINM